MVQKDEDDLDGVDLGSMRPMTGKLKGGPKKVPDVKSKVSSPKTKASMPKSDKSSGGKSSFKAPKGGGKISKPSQANYVKVPSAKKADTTFSLPKPGMPKRSPMKAAGGKKRR